jgi:hypothetical protein
VRDGRVVFSGRRVRAREEYRLSSLVKYKKKGKLTLSFTSLEKDFFFNIYEVITSPERKTLDYSLLSLYLPLGLLHSRVL